MYELRNSRWRLFDLRYQGTTKRTRPRPLRNSKRISHPFSCYDERVRIDSLDFVDIVVIVEKNFGFKIKPEEMKDVKTLGQFYDYITTKVN